MVIDLKAMISIKMPNAVESSKDILIAEIAWTLI